MDYLETIERLEKADIRVSGTTVFVDKKEKEIDGIYVNCSALLMEDLKNKIASILGAEFLIHCMTNNGYILIKKKKQ